jgi:hypothetical protein
MHSPHSSFFSLLQIQQQIRAIGGPGSIDMNEAKYIQEPDRELLNIGLVKDRGMASLAQFVEIIVETSKRIV